MRAREKGGDLVNLGLSFLASVERDPRHLAIVDGALRLTYEAWLARIRHVAGGLRRMGLGPGERLLVVLKNGEPMTTLYWACQTIGAIFAPVNWRLGRNEFHYVVQDAAPVAVAFEPASAALGELAEAEGLRTLGVALTAPHRATYDSLLEAPAFEGDFVGDESISLLLYTSGTTGRPKGVPRSHRAERAAAVAHVAQNRYGRDEVTLGVMPLYHTMGVRSLIAMTLLNGTFVAMPQFRPREALEAIERERVTNLYLAPTLYFDLVHLPEIATRDLRSLRKLGYAGAPMSPSLVERCFEVFQPEIFVNHYGSTEIYTFSIYDRLREKPACAGRAGLNERLRIVRIGAQSSGDVAPPGETGEIVVELTSDEAFQGYRNRPDADARAIRGGWYFTGDLGRLDEDGDLFVVGRVDDMIISGGENVFPVEVEDALARHPDVGRVAVIGVPDERLGQRIVAYVEPAAQVPSAEGLDRFCIGSGMTPFKRPREYVFVKNLPLSPSGKILRTKLRSGEVELLAQESMR
ncbi:long-chain fatty acid--CoA ligase [bacterium]|nr:MAG: long-chain fatty acid--CoA ligase [bacterium]